MAEFDEQLEVADVYAAALHDLASAENEVGEVRAELDELVKLPDLEPDFAMFLETDALDAAGRKAGLEKMFRGKLSDLVLNTMLVMADHGRAGFLKALHRRFVLRQEDAADEIEVTATSAVELTAEQKAEVVRTAAKVSGKKPLVEYEIDPSLVGGLVLRVGALLLDNSVRRQLQTARQRLFDRAERGLAAQ